MWYEGGSGGGWKKNGWFCELFYNYDDDTKYAPVVADVHTAPPSPDFGFNGTVLTEGVGNVNIMLVSFKSGEDVTVYAGPVYSHYETTPPSVSRLNDDQWKEIVQSKRNTLTRPEWTKDYLVPSDNKPLETDRSKLRKHSGFF